MKKCGWFNQGMPLLEEVFAVVKSVGDPDIFLVCSHRQDDFSGRNQCDLFVKEPAGLEGEAYVQYCLDFARTHGVDLFVPSRLASLLVANRARFAAIGVKMLTAGDADVLDLMRSKTRCYEALGWGLVPMPEYRVFANLAEFEEAYSYMSSRHKVVCFKPVCGVFAHGFRVVTPDGKAFERLMATGPYTATTEIGLSEARILFGERSEFEPFMMMEYLEGRERSVDCIAEKGKLLRSIIRFKDTHSTQLMEANAHVDDLIDRIVAKLNLDGVFNVQFRNHNDEPYLLEINSRMSGGLHKACLASEFPLPYWALRLALGTVTASAVPFPKTGMRLRKEKIYSIESDRSVV